MTHSEIPAAVAARIDQRLAALQAKHGVRILHAIESGSRAWGFASPDSDYDARFIYCHEPDWYFSVFEQRDVIESPIETEAGAVFDVNGWDLRKALRLLAKGNPVLVEWLRSPIVYQAAPGFADALLALASRFHSPRATHYHYFHMANRNFREHLGGARIRLKKYFYVIRPVLACLWVEHGLGLPPMTLAALLDGVLPAGPVHDDILNLRECKMREPEFGEGPPVPRIHDFLKAELDRLAAVAVPGPIPIDPSALDAFLRRWAGPS